MRILQASFWTLLVILAGLSVQAHSCLPVTKHISCDEMALIRPAVKGEHVQCFRRHWLFRSYESVVYDNRGGVGHLVLPLEFREKASGKALYMQSVRDPNQAVILGPDGKQELGGSSGTGTIWSALTRVRTPIPDDIGQVTIKIIDQWGPFEFIPEVTGLPTGVHAGTGPLTQTPPASQSYWGISVLLILFVGTAVAMAVRQKNFLHWTIAITTLAFAFTVVCGMPYGSATGWYDPGDDRSYVQWTYHFGYLFDPFITHGDMHSWAQTSNHHTWGTGLILAPFVMGARLIWKDLGPGGIILSLMSLGVILVAYLSIVVYFAAFLRIASDWAAALAACGTLACTNLLKWTYMRNLFSHSPEALALSVATYGAIGRYFTHDNRRRDLTSLAVGLFMAIQVRRENAGLLALVLAFEVFRSLGDGAAIHHASSASALSLRTIAGKILERWQGFAAIVGSGIAAIFVLLLTNYLTDLRAFFGSVPNSGYFHLSNWWSMVEKNFTDVTFSAGSGLFHWKNLWAIVPLIYIIPRVRYWRVWLPCLGIVCAYVAMCIFYEYPTGSEWQNRFLLKLNPIFLGALAVMMARESVTWRLLAVGAIVFGGYFELTAYTQQLPGGMAFYISDFGDHVLLNPPTFHGLTNHRFYFPLMALAGTTAILASWRYFCKLRLAKHLRGKEGRV